MEVASFQLFVYGSLRSGFRTPAYEYLARYFDFLGEATVKGKLFLHEKVPVAVASTDDTIIKGELYALKKPSDYNWAFGQLDDYEGVSVEHGEHPKYKRDITLTSCNGKDDVAWIYWYNGPTAGLPALGTTDLMDYIRNQNK